MHARVCIRLQLNGLYAGATLATTTQLYNLNPAGSVPLYLLSACNEFKELNIGRKK